MLRYSCRNGMDMCDDFDVEIWTNMIQIMKIILQDYRKQYNVTNM